MTILGEQGLVGMAKSRSFEQVDLAHEDLRQKLRDLALRSLACRVNVCADSNFSASRSLNRLGPPGFHQVASESFAFDTLPGLTQSQILQSFEKTGAPNGRLVSSFLSKHEGSQA